MKESEKQPTKLEVDEKRIDIKIKRLQAKEKLLQISQWEKDKLMNENGKTNVAKMESLLQLLRSLTIDEERSIIGSEPIFKPIFDELERETIKNKVIEIMKRY